MLSGERVSGSTGSTLRTTWGRDKWVNVLVVAMGGSSASYGDGWCESYSSVRLGSGTKRGSMCYKQQ